VGTTARDEESVTGSASNASNSSRTTGGLAQLGHRPHLVVLDEPGEPVHGECVDRDFDGVGGLHRATACASRSSRRHWYRARP
jgi:hypothetical protein